MIFSDSLGRPRPHLVPPDRTEYEETYGYRLRKHLFPQHEVEICYFVSLDSEEALTLVDYQVVSRKPDLVIFHFGINDCAPRIFKKSSRNMIFRPWFPSYIKRVVLGLIRRNRGFLTRYVFRKRVYVRPDRFLENLIRVRESILTHRPQCEFLALSILPTVARVNQRSFGFNGNVARYNAILAEVFRDGYIDLDELLGGDPEAYLISDGIHLTGKSHAVVADYLHTRIAALWCKG